MSSPPDNVKFCRDHDHFTKTVLVANGRQLHLAWVLFKVCQIVFSDAAILMKIVREFMNSFL